MVQTLGLYNKSFFEQANDVFTAQFESCYVSK